MSRCSNVSYKKQQQTPTPDPSCSWYEGLGPSEDDRKSVNMSQCSSSENDSLGDSEHMGFIHISPEVLTRIKSYIQELPPLYDEQLEEKIPKSYFDMEFLDKQTVGIREKLEMLPAITRIHSIDDLLMRDFCARTISQEYLRVQELRSLMPIAKIHDKIIHTIHKYPFFMICADVGTGKSSQVPQYILDDYLISNRSSLCKIISLQPDRLTAISLAERVACERSEPVGISVGYMTGHEQNLPRMRASIVFCTVDILLKDMEKKEVFTMTSHLILDIGHNRNMLHDLILAIVKQSIGKTRLNVIVLSEPVNVNAFRNYFGATYIVELHLEFNEIIEYFLEDILFTTGYSFAGKCFDIDITEESATEFKRKIVPYLKGLEEQNLYDNQVREDMQNPISEHATYELTLHIIHFISNALMDEGHILVILSCWEEVNLMYQYIANSDDFPRSKYIVYTLHLHVHAEQQHNIFYPEPTKKRIIILSTNVVESCPSISNVTFIIDHGKLVVNEFYTAMNRTDYKSEFVSMESAVFRRDRARAYRPTTYFRLYSRHRAEIFSALVPEMLYKPLDLVVLTLKLLKLGDARVFLQTCINPPKVENINKAIYSLQQLDALDDNENLTPLGIHLARMKLPPQVGKMMLLGALFSCANPILDIAASFLYKCPFFFPTELADEIKRNKLELADGFQSDHLLIHLALHRLENDINDKIFCGKYFVSHEIMLQLLTIKQRLVDLLNFYKYLNNTYSESDDANVNSQNFSLIKSIVSASFISNILIAKTTCTRAKNRTTLYTLNDRPLDISTNSILTREEQYDSPIFIYCYNMSETSESVSDATMIFPIQLLFFAHKLKVNVHHDNSCNISVYNKITFRMTRECAKLIMELRDRLNYYLVWKTAEPAMVNWDNDQEATVLKAIISLLVMDSRGYKKF